MRIRGVLRRVGLALGVRLFLFRWKVSAFGLRVLLAVGDLRAFSVMGNWVYVRRPVWNVKYVADILDLGQWAADVRDLLVKRVAMDIAMAVCGVSSVVQEAERRYLVALGDAKRLDSSEGQEFDFEGMDPISASMESAVPRVDFGAVFDAIEGRLYR